MQAQEMDTRSGHLELQHPQPTQMTPRQDIPAGRSGYQQLRQIVHPMQYATQRDEWPHLWEALDDLVALADSSHTRPAESPGLFDIDTSGIHRSTH